MKFWLKTFRLLLVYAGLAVLYASVVFYVLKYCFGFGFVVNSLLTCIGAVSLLYLTFYVIVYKEKWYEIADKYVESIDLIQNILFFIFFPYLGIVLAQVDAPQELMSMRQIIGATLLTLKITMLLIKYTLKHAPLDDLD